MNTLYCSDNLMILQDYIKVESLAVDIEILAVEGLLSGKTVNPSPHLTTYKQAEKISVETAKQNPLEFE